MIYVNRWVPEVIAEASALAMFSAGEESVLYLFQGKWNFPQNHTSPNLLLRFWKRRKTFSKLNFALWRGKDETEPSENTHFISLWSFSYIVNSEVGTGKKMLNKMAMVFSPHPAHSL